MSELFHEWYVRQSALRDVTLGILTDPGSWRDDVILGVLILSFVAILFFSFDEVDDPHQPKEH